MNNESIQSVIAYGEKFTVSTSDAAILETLNRQYGLIETSPPCIAPALNYVRDELLPEQVTPSDFRYQISENKYSLECKGVICLEIDARAYESIQCRYHPNWLNQYPDLFRSLLVEAPVLIFLAWLKFPYVHAAAIARDGKGYLLLGYSGAGKSCLAFACIKEGFQFLAEDIVFFAPTKDGIELRGNPISLKLCEESVEFFPEISSLPTLMQSNGEMKIDVLPFIPKDRRLDRVPLRGIFLLPTQSVVPSEALSQDEIQNMILENLMFDPVGMMNRYMALYHELVHAEYAWLPQTGTPAERVKQLKIHIREFEK
jgi:hypothetical protein